MRSFWRRGCWLFKGKFLLRLQTHFKGNYYQNKRVIRNIWDKCYLELPHTRELDFVPSINKYNELAKQTPQVAIFPYVLYVFIAKQEPKTERNVVDNMLFLQGGLYPSMNVLSFIRPHF